MTTVGNGKVLAGARSKEPSRERVVGGGRGVLPTAHYGAAVGVSIGIRPWGLQGGQASEPTSWRYGLKKPFILWFSSLFVRSPFGLKPFCFDDDDF